MGLSKSVQFGQLYTVNCATETQWVQWWKAALNPLVSIWSVSFEFSFCGGNTRFTYVFAVSTSKLSQLQNKKKLNLLTIPFLAIYLLNRGKSSYIYQSSMRVNNTFRKIIDCDGEKHCCDSPCQTSSVVFSKVYLRFFFLKGSPIDWCQIVTDTCKNNVSKFV